VPIKEDYPHLVVAGPEVTDVPAAKKSTAGFMCQPETQFKMDGFSE
jgi:hypothetical protein